MKIRHLSNGKTAAGALFYTVILLALAATWLVSYMLLTENQYLSVGRSQVWNASMVNAEAGVEEAMAMINTYKTTAGAITNWQTLAATNGWTLVTSNINSIYPWTVTTSNSVYYISRNNSGDNITGGRYEVYINSSLTATNGPEIYAIGYANANGLTTASNAVRSIYVQTVNVSQLGNDGLIGNQLTFDGNNVTIDSFDSSNPNHSIWHTNLWFHGTNYGTWSASLSYDSNSIPSRTANVHVVGVNGLVAVDNADIYGYVVTGPGGKATIKNNGSVGDLNWVHSGTSGLQDGHFRDDLNQTFPSLQLPNPSNSFQTTWLPVVTGRAGTTNVIRIGAVYSNGILVGAGTLYTNKNNAGWVLPNGDGTTSTFKMVLTNTPWTCAATNIFYTTNSLSGYLYVDCQYGVLYLPSGMNSPNIVINTNADLTIYSGGNITLGTTYNNTELARALTICDIAGNPISVTASGNASGVAKYYIPSSSITLHGGGKDTVDIIGEIVCYSAEFDGHFNLHFDESLTSSSPSHQYVAINWKEVGSY